MSEVEHRDGPVPRVPAAWRLLLIFTALAIAVPAALKMAGHDVLQSWLLMEDGVYETIGTVSVALASLVFLAAAIASPRGRRGWLSARRAWLILFAIGVFVVAGEEINWGQRILEFDMPSWLEAASETGEFNLHNTVWLQGDEPSGVWQAIRLLVNAGPFAYLVVLPFFPLGWRSAVERSGLPIASRPVAVAVGISAVGNMARLKWIGADSLNMQQSDEIREIVLEFAVFWFALECLAATRPSDAAAARVLKRGAWGLAALLAVLVPAMFLPGLSPDTIRRDAYAFDSRYHIMDGDTERATAQLRELVRIEPENRDFRLRLASVLLAAGELSEAETSFAAAAGLPGGAEAGHHGLAAIRALQGRPREALQHIEMGLRASPKSPGLLLLRAKLHWGLNDRATAIESLQSAVEHDPRHAASRWELAVYLLQLERYTEAEQHLRVFLEEHPERANAFNLLGVCQVHLGDRGGAEASFRRALELDPNLNDAAMNLQRLRETAPAP